MSVVAGEPVVVADTRCRTGESPQWHPGERCVYWIDIPAGEIRRFHPATGEVELVHRGEEIGALLLHVDGGLVLLQDEGRVAHLRDGVLRVLVPRLDALAGTRFNDAIADAAGRIYSGTMPTPDGRALLLRLDPDGVIEVAYEEPGQSNGLAFGPDGKSLFWTNTLARRIVRFAYDRATGALGDARTAADLAGAKGVPDGLAADAEGRLWSARWGEGAVVRLDAEGRELERIELPAEQVAGVAFGGDDGRDLYVATAGGDDRARHGAGAGALFRVRLRVAGFPRHFARFRSEQP